MKTLPAPGRDVATSVPPSASDVRRAYGRPRPVPRTVGCRRFGTWTNSSNTASSWSAGIPRPVSRTSNRTTSPSAAARSTTSPSSVNFTAFVSRLRSTRDSSRRSVTSVSPGSAATRSDTPDRTSGRVVPRSSSSSPEVDERGLDVVVAGLGAREVEQLVDEREQRRRALAQEPDLLRLVGVEVGVREERGEADDRVHGRAQLVADVPQEAGLRLVGGGELAPALVELGVQRDDAGVGLLGSAESWSYIARTPRFVSSSSSLKRRSSSCWCVSSSSVRTSSAFCTRTSSLASATCAAAVDRRTPARVASSVRAVAGRALVSSTRVPVGSTCRPGRAVGRPGRRRRSSRPRRGTASPPRSRRAAWPAEPGQDAHDDVGRAGADRGPPDLDSAVATRTWSCVSRPSSRQISRPARRSASTSESERSWVMRRVVLTRPPGDRQHRHAGVVAAHGVVAEQDARDDERGPDGEARIVGERPPGRQSVAVQHDDVARLDGVRRLAQRPAARPGDAGVAHETARPRAVDRPGDVAEPGAAQHAVRRPDDRDGRAPGAAEGAVHALRGARPGCREARRGRPAPRPRRPPRRAVRGRARRRRGDSARRRRGAPRGRRRTRPARSWGGSRPWGPRGRWSRRARRTSPR